MTSKGFSLLPVVSQLKYSVALILALLLLNEVEAIKSPFSYSTITPANRTQCPETGPTPSPPSNRVDTTEQLRMLRQEMESWNLSAYLIVMTDEHGSYYGTGYYAMVDFMSGFSGSNGYAVVTLNHSAVWTDGRYFLQADNQMDCNWILMKMGESGYPANAWDWLKTVLTDGDRVGAFPNFVDQSTWSNYETNLRASHIEFVAVHEELVDKIWSGRPPKNNNQLMVHHIDFAGVSWKDKMDDIRNKIAPSNVLIVTVLEQVAWLFNLRGSDKTSSLFYGYAIVHERSARLYVTNYTALISNSTIQRHLEIDASGNCLNPGSAHCIHVFEYNSIYDYLRNLSDVNIWVDPTANYAIYSATSNLLNVTRTVAVSPIERTKSIKNDVEKRRFRECIFRDSAAVIEFAAFLEDRIVNKGEKNWTELDASEKLLNIRRTYDYFQGVSFTTIAAVGKNAAVIHYRPDESTNANISTDSVFLLDSGGQYLDGTTDVTRTFHFGTPSEVVKEAYTRVLMGQIDLAQAVWPEGLHGYELDVIARLPLHRNGWDYNHGTGHGIGYFLSVHEGPARIAKGYSSTSQPLAEGMFFSDEPGFYEDNQYGIRLESLVTVVKAKTNNNFGSKQYLAFDTLTLVPHEPKLIKYELLSVSQKQWLNKFNEQIRKEMGDYVMTNRTNHMAHMWVEARTAPIPLYDISNSHRATSGLIAIVLSLIASSYAILL